MTPDEAMAMAREAVQERARQLHYCAEGHTKEACWSDREHDAALDRLIELAKQRGAYAAWQIALVARDDPTGKLWLAGTLDSQDCLKAAIAKAVRDA